VFGALRLIARWLYFASTYVTDFEVVHLTGHVDISWLEPFFGQGNLRRWLSSQEKLPTGTYFKTASKQQEARSVTLRLSTPTSYSAVHIVVYTCFHLSFTILWCLMCKPTQPMGSNPGGREPLRYAFGWDVARQHLVPILSHAKLESTVYCDGSWLVCKIGVTLPSPQRKVAHLNLGDRHGNCLGVGHMYFRW
jgi:hypothetical protein